MIHLDDPKAHILYEESQFGNYVIIPNDEPKQIIEDPILGKLWTMEFDGSCSKLGSNVCVVQVPPLGELIPFSCKIDFKNTNNTLE